MKQIIIFLVEKNRLSYFMFALCFRETLCYVSNISLSYIFCLLSFMIDMFLQIKVKLESSNDGIPPTPRNL